MKKINLENKNNSKNKFYLIVFIILILIFTMSITIIIKWIYETQKTKSIISNIMNEVIINDSKEDINYSDNNDKKIDFQKLLETNEQVICWIKINNTNIDYPVLKGNDNNYYLHRNILKDYSQNGWIFMDYRNNEDMSDNNTIFFGHNIKSGIMFSDLKKIYNGEIKGKIYIDIYKKNGEELRYVVYSCYMEKPDEYSINPKVSDSDYNDFLVAMKSKSIYDYNIEFSENRTITLSTCDSSGKKRILVHAIREY